MIVHLPMYDWPEVRSQHQLLWRHLRSSLQAVMSAGINLPEALLSGADERNYWTSAELLLGQTCGLPFAQGLYRETHLVGSPDYGLPGCGAGEYNSVILGSRSLPCESLAELNQSIEAGTGSALVAAVNSRCSQSGYSALLHSLSGGALGEVVLSGSHRKSVQMLAAGKAEVASIDAVSWALARRYEPAARHLKVLGYSQPTPSLPLITSQSQLAEVLCQGISQALQTLDVNVKQALLLEAVVPRTAEAYMYLAPRLEEAEQKHWQKASA